MNQKAKAAKSISFDMKLSYAYFVAIMILLATRLISSPKTLVILACSLWGILTALSVTHKIKSRWRWPGIAPKHLLYAVINIVWGVVLFAYASHIMLPKEPAPWEAETLSAVVKRTWELVLKAGSRPTLTPWFLFGAGIFVFNTLYALRFMTMKQDNFLRNCNTGQQGAEGDAVPRGP